jgi:hypothetical protein
MAKMQEEMELLKKALEEAKSSSGPKTPAPKKTFGISRPSTVSKPANQTSATIVTDTTASTSTPNRSVKTPMTAR